MATTRQNYRLVFFILYAGLVGDFDKVVFICLCIANCIRPREWAEYHSYIHTFCTLDTLAERSVKRIFLETHRKRTFSNTCLRCLLAGGCAPSSQGMALSPLHYSSPAVQRSWSFYGACVWILPSPGPRYRSELDAEVSVPAELLPPRGPCTARQPPSK